MTLLALKKTLHSHCLSYVEQRIQTSQDAITQAQASANEETKSSAGDKYETGRAMMQIEIEKNTHQLREAQKLMHVLHQINPEQTSNRVQPGSLVTTNRGKFYIAISAGSCVIGHTTYTTLSPASPLGTRMAKLQSGAVFEFNGQSYSVLDVS